MQNGASIDKVTLLNHTPLHEACSRGYHAIAQMLLDHGANPNALDSRGYSAVHHAVANGRSEALDVLLQKGADPNLFGTNSVSDDSPTTPLCLAIALENEKIARQLLDAGAVPDMPVRGASPLHRAIAMGHLKLVRALVDHRHALDTLDDAGLSPLVLAVRQRSAEIARLLLESGAGPNFPSQSPGWTALHEAVSIEDPELVSLVLAFLPDPNVAETSQRLTPLHLAASKGLFDIASRLLAAHADVNLADHLGNRPIHFATAGSHSSLALLLCSQPSISHSEAAASALHQFLSLVQGEFQQAQSQHLPPTSASLRLDTHSIQSPSTVAVTKPAPTPKPAMAAPSIPPPALPSGIRPPRPDSGYLAASPIAEPADTSVRPRRRETVTMQYNAKQYIQQAQQSLSKDQYLYFQGMLRDYKSKNLDINELIHKVIELFAETQQNVLMRDFVQFIPDRYKESYSDQVASFLDPDQ